MNNIESDITRFPLIISFKRFSQADNSCSKLDKS